MMHTKMKVISISFPVNTTLTLVTQVIKPKYGDLCHDRLDFTISRKCLRLPAVHLPWLPLASLHGSLAYRLIYKFLELVDPG